MFETILKRFVAKIDDRRVNRFFRAYMVLALDLLVSVAASTCTYLLIGIIRSVWVNSTLSLAWFLGALFASLLSMWAAKSYKTIIRYSTLRECYSLMLASIGKGFLMFCVLAAISLYSQRYSIRFMCAVVLADFALSLSALIVVRILMVVGYGVFVKRISENIQQKRVLIYGLDEKAVSMIARLRLSNNFRVEGFVSEQASMDKCKILGLPIYVLTDEKSVDKILAKSHANALLFTHRTDAQKEYKRLVSYCKGCEMYIAPSIDKVDDNNAQSKAIRKIKIEDLLGRPEIKISMDEIISNFKDKTILVTGAAGSIGSELCRQLATFGIKKLVMFDNAETPMHNIRLEFEEKFPDLKFHPVIGDVRYPERLDFVFRTYHPQVVFHAAAYKHVPLMEENPCEAVLANVYGSRNVADKCLKYDVEKMVMISTDKAVNPTNIMGCTKRLAEIYVQTLGLAIEQGKLKGHTRFVTTRFGNVLGSNGSVIPLFNAQIAAGGPITVTHPDIVRYFMSIPEACRLVMEAAAISSGNQICVFDMGKPVKISFLAEQMIRFAGLRVGEDIEIKYTGLRPGEKLYEEVLATKENTLPTRHESIFVARVRDYDYNDAREAVDELIRLAQAVDIPNMVRLMKTTVPEFKSKNSPFEVYDK